MEGKLSRSFGHKLDTAKTAVAAKVGLAKGLLSPFADHSADNGFGRQ